MIHPPFPISAIAVSQWDRKSKARAKRPEPPPNRRPLIPPTTEKRARQNLGLAASIAGMARDKLEEIAAKRLRGQKGAGWRGRSELNALEREWRSGDGPLKLPAQLIANRLELGSAHV